MKGYTENKTVILGDALSVFRLTNDVKKWADLFSEYKVVDILEDKGNLIVFQLTTFDGKSWLSERKIDEQKMLATARRIRPMFPFTEMYITWKYEKLPNNIGVIMTWIQEFDVDPKCGHEVYDMESYINRSTRKQMKSVKNKVECLLNEKNK